jgi:hypothetical protein
MRMPEPKPHSSSQLARFAKWSGLAFGPVAWAVDQQLVSQSAYITCPDFDSTFAVFVGILCGALAISGILVSASARRRLRRHPQLSTSSADPFIASVCAMVAAVSLLAIVFGTSASIVLQCQR